MNREVYKHIISTYGRSTGIWLSLTAEAIRTIVMRVYVVILIASLAAAITAGEVAKAEQYIWLYIAFALAAALIGAAGELIGNKAENDIYGKQMEIYYKKLTNKDMSFYRDSHTGYLTAQFRQYLDGGILLARMYRSDFVRTVVSLTAPVGVLLYYSWPVGILAAAIVLLQAAYVVWASAKAEKYRKATHEIYRQISGEVADDISNIIAYKSAGHEQDALKRIMKLRKQETLAFWLRRKVVILLDLPRTIVTFTLTALAFLLVLRTTPSASESVALLVLTLTYMFQITRNVSDLPDLISRHDDLITKIGPTLSVFSPVHETIKDSPQASTSAIQSGEIEIKNLDFRYNPQSSKYIFKNFNLHIAPGEHIGVVGLSGAGKSTLASLLLRFDEVTSGSILIDDIDIRDIAQSKLRQKIAYVPQEPVLFHRSIRDNIAYHNSEADDAKILKAAKAAHAHDFIAELPDGYDTLVGERGVKLSGGQKQRIVIARAVLKNAPILLFDEATSALDSESEHIIQQALPGIIGNHTAIVIAHRLSTVASLDKIIVMHKGKIEEQGTHNELLHNKARYWSLWQKQIGL